MGTRRTGVLHGGAPAGAGASASLRCRRCGCDLTPTPAGVADLAWFDVHRVTAQGWLGRVPEEAVGVECLTPDEANFLLPERESPAARPAGLVEARARRFERSAPEFVADWMVA
jgi:hypothetical protein